MIVSSVMGSGVGLEGPGTAARTVMVEPVSRSDEEECDPYEEILCFSSVSCKGVGLSAAP